MEFPKENPIDNFINDFNKKHPILGRWISLKVKLKLLYINYVRRFI